MRLIWAVLVSVRVRENLGIRDRILPCEWNRQQLFRMALEQSLPSKPLLHNLKTKTYTPPTSKLIFQILDVMS